jgi:heme/copper-type cytochrome/quinol oxidase subunit 2
MNMNEQDNLLDQVAGIFLRCFLMCYALLLLWFVLFMLAGNWAYSIQAGWFELSRHDFALVNYFGIAFTKICGIIFFLFPYVSIKLVLRKKRKNS